MTSGVMRKPYIQFSNVPEELWSDSPIDVVRGQPEPWADRLADEVEIQRLLGMGVLQKRCEFEGEISGTLTTRFVYDWRLKTYDGACSFTCNWMSYIKHANGLSSDVEAVRVKRAGQGKL